MSLLPDIDILMKDLQAQKALSRMAEYLLLSAS
jgi:hypothetical protein